MNALFRPIAIAGILILVACTAPVRNVDSAPLGAPAGATTTQISNAIKEACASLNWRIVGQQAGNMKAELRLRSHVALVEIAYTRRTFSITYLDSTNLKYDGTNIHKNYNGWIQNLSNAIQVRASAI